MKLQYFIPKWVSALRSGKYKPLKGFMIAYQNHEPCYCFMGVACKELGFTDVEIQCKKNITATMAKDRLVPEELIGNYRTNKLVREITRLNDIKEYSQEQFANWLEDNLLPRYEVV